MKKSIIKITVFTVFVTLMTGLTYFIVGKFLKDRADALSVMPRSTLLRRPQNPFTTTKTFTQEELRNAKQKGMLPDAARHPFTNSQPADDAVQRSLKTIQEINKINEMNQRLIDQQQRLQKTHQKN